MNKYLTITLILLLMVGSFLFFYKVSYPSKLSIQYFCQEVSLEELNDLGYVLGGTYTPSSDIITIISDDPGTRRHEQCHRSQDLKGRLNTCEEPHYKLYFDEMECQFAEIMPNFIFNKIYN